jgi:DNA gyrase subunit A
MGYGIATSIPNYNFTEVCELTINLIKDNFYEPCILIPECATGCHIIDNGQFKEACDTGKGKFIMRGKIQIDEEVNMIRIMSVPFQVTEGDIKLNIIKLQDEKKVNGIIRIQDDTTEGVVDLKLFLKKEVDAHEIVNVIYKKTLMERTFGIQLKLIHDNQDFNYNLRELILEWVDIRREQKRRYYNQKLAKLKNREHMLEILLFISNKDNAEKTIGYIRKSENRKSAMEKLMSAYHITSLQAEVIADMRLAAFSKDSHKRYKEEKTEIEERVKELEHILSKANEMDNIIIEELKEGIQLFGTPRKSKIVVVQDDEKYIKDSNHLLVFTQKGYVKKLPHDSTNIGSLVNGDRPLEIITVNNRKDVMIFDETAKITKLTVCGLQNHEFNSDGERLSKYGTVVGNIVSVLVKPDIKYLESVNNNMSYLFLTRNGVIKKTSADKYVNVRNEIMGSIVKPNDKLIQVKSVIGDRDLVIYTNNGIALRFNSSDIKETGRMSMGISACNLEAGDYVIGMDIMADDDKYVMVLTNKGSGKKCTLDNFKRNNRNDPLLRLITLGEEEEICLARTVKGTELFKVFTKNTVEEIEVTDIPDLPRMSRGKKIIPLLKGNYIIDVKEVKRGF